MLDNFDAVKQGNAEDSALRVTTDMSAADLALASIKLYPEEYHRYTTGMLAEHLGVKTHMVQKMVKKLNIKGNSDYHLKIKIGASEKSVVHKYSEQALELLRDEMSKSGELNVKVDSLQPLSSLNLS
jgi:DNA-binding MarR family transcriptional regulator